MLLSLLYVNTAVPSSFSVLPIFSRLDKLLYFIYKQEYLEFISRNENQKGLHFLYKYIKPLESVCEAQHAGEFKELCYLLSFKVRSLPLLVSPERSELSLLRALARRAEVPGDSRRHAVARVLRRERDSRKASRFCVRLISQVPPNRLVTLLKQAYSYQASQTFPNTPRSMRIVSLLEDINGYPLPSFLEDCQQHVEGPIKGVAVLCESSVAVSARNALYVWNRQEPDPTLKRIGGHNGLIWDLQINPSTHEVVTGGSDGLVKIWSSSKDTAPVELSASQNDVYAVSVHPLASHLIAAGCFDGSVQLFNAEQRASLKVLFRSQLSSRNTCRTHRRSPLLRLTPREICCFRGERTVGLRRGMW